MTQRKRIPHRPAPCARRVATASAFVLAFAAAGAQAQVATSCPTGYELTQAYAYSGAPVTFAVPANITSVHAIAVGADGGNASTNTNTGGTGANIAGTFAVTPGQQFTVLVGQSGRSGDFDSGGGGASGVYLQGALAIIAGGGGGDDNTGNGRGGSAAVNGSNGGSPVGQTCSAGGLGGIGGAGGQFGEIEPPANCQTGQGGAGGGGLNAAGGSSAIQNPAGRRGPTGGAACSILGAAGGQGGALDPTGQGGDGNGVAGGWGACGGGGSDDRESGGGGGYSGGGGGPEGQYPGGGGSFLSAPATARSLVAGTDGGGSARDGAVRLCWSLRADLQVTKTNTPALGVDDRTDDSVAAGATTVYSVVVTNLGQGNGNGSVVRDTPTAGLTCTSATCGSATGGAACPAPAALTPATLAAGVAIPTLPPGGSVTISLTCTVQ